MNKYKLLISSIIQFINLFGVDVSFNKINKQAYNDITNSSNTKQENIVLLNTLDSTNTGGSSDKIQLISKSHKNINTTKLIVKPGENIITVKCITQEKTFLHRFHIFSGGFNQWQVAEIR